MLFANHYDLGVLPNDGNELREYFFYKKNPLQTANICTHTL